jgi:hypothetical protein
MDGMPGERCAVCLASLKAECLLELLEMLDLNQYQIPYAHHIDNPKPHLVCMLTPCVHA